MMIQEEVNKIVLDRVGQAPHLVSAMMESGATRLEILNYLVAIAEEMSGPDATASILVLDDEGLLRNGASPNLPTDYLAAIDRLKPDKNLGTCAAAAAIGEVVITPDFMTDKKWPELKHLPLSLGYIAAWSAPIKTPDGTVLGTFGTYFRNRRYPTDEEMAGMFSLVHAAAIVLEHVSDNARLN